MTERKPALRQYTDFENGGKVILASDLPPAILNATKEELAALAVFAEAMPELLRLHAIHRNSYKIQLATTAVRALAAAKEAEP